jgi:GNAT superfamily N-acetyltransferase
VDLSTFAPSFFHGIENLLMSENIKIRPATEADIPAIHALVYELAVYEKEPEAVLTSPEEYLADFRDGRFECQVAELDGRVVGMILYFMAYSSWKGKMLYLDDFVVTEACRGLGIGQKLYDTFLEEGRRRGCRLVKWQVLDWNEPAIRFYERNEAIIEKNWWNVKSVISYQ